MKPSEETFIPECLECEGLGLRCAPGIQALKMSEMVCKDAQGALRQGIGTRFSS